jgi:ClpP class serine protease
MQDRAQGRVWSGAAALEQGLVDAIGGVPRAIAIAKQAAKIGGELCTGFAGCCCARQASSQAPGLQMLQQGCGWEHSCSRRCCSVCRQQLGSATGSSHCVVACCFTA